MIILREVRPSDLDDLEVLARRLNTLNLPADRDRLRAIIESSRMSFGGRYESITDREYVFVMVDLEAERVIGSCMIIAQHGTFERPSVYFQVRQEQTYSSTIERHFVHQVLQLTFHYDGPTEIGGLILDPDYRKHPLKLGKLLSFVRFLYIGMHRDHFRDAIVAELLPPLNPDGTSDLWRHVGHNFTGLDYTTADRISRENIEFIRALFPTTPLYTSLLPPNVRAQIGQVGANTKPVERMLTQIGFRYNFHIDPFDGGPTYSVQTEQCEPVARTTSQIFAGELDEHEQADGQAIVGHEYDSHMVRFRALFAEYRHTPYGVLLRAPALSRLRATPGDAIGFLPMTGPDLRALY
jgi:arginine N-succinyltransferase